MVSRSLFHLNAKYFALFSCSANSGISWHSFSSGPPTLVYNICINTAIPIWSYRQILESYRSFVQAVSWRRPKITPVGQFIMCGTTLRTICLLNTYSGGKNLAWQLKFCIFHVCAIVLFDLKDIFMTIIWYKFWQWKLLVNISGKKMYDIYSSSASFSFCLEKSLDQFSLVRLCFISTYW